MKCIAFLSLFLAFASAEFSPPELQCPPSNELFQWIKLDLQHERLCVSLQREERDYDAAHDYCKSHNADLLSFRHNADKLKTIVDWLRAEEENKGMKSEDWYVNRFGVQNFVENLDLEKHNMEKHNDRPHLRVKKLKKDRDTNDDKLHFRLRSEEFELKMDKGESKRAFICETHGVLIPQRPKFAVQPADAFVLNDQQTSSFVRLSCLAIGNPKPIIRWYMVQHNATHPEQYKTQHINASLYTDFRDVMAPTEQIAYRDLRINCSKHPERCPEFTEQSILYIKNTQFLTGDHYITCAAENTYGEVLSRESRIRMTSLGQYPDPTVTPVTETRIIEGQSLYIPCGTIEHSPNILTVEFFKHEKSDKVRNVFEYNDKKENRFFVSQADRALVIDSIEKKDEGMYACVVRMPNGVGFVTRQRIFAITVEECKKDEPCQKDAAQVLPGYPTVFSGDFHTNNKVYVRDTFFLECLSVGQSEKIQWEKNMVEFDADLRSRTVFYNHKNVVRIDFAKLTDQGTYRCRVAKGDTWSEWKSVTVIINARQELFSRPMDQEKTVGESSEIFCTVLGAPSKIVPIRGRSQFFYDESSRQELVSLTERHMQARINLLEQSDANTYGCRAVSRSEDGLVDVDYYYATLTVKL